MDSRSLLCILFLHFLIIAVTQAHEDGKAEHHHPPHEDHMDKHAQMFFTLKEFDAGKTLPIYFYKDDPSKVPPLLPKHVADSIPFSSSELPNLFRYFSISPTSPMGKAMTEAIQMCEEEPIRGETKACATSFESMLDFVTRSFGTHARPQPLQTILPADAVSQFQNYTIIDYVRVASPMIVPCHTVSYPYALYYCHYTDTETRVFMTSLQGENGDRVESLAVCHMDTSLWNQDHISFKVLGVKPPREVDLDLSDQNSQNQAFSRKHWRLLQCQNGLRIFEELIEVDYLPRSCSRAMKAVGVVEATCEDIFELLMSMDGKRYEWDCSFQYGSLVEEVDGHTAILYHRLQLDWFPTLVWPRDLCYVRYWRRNDDGSYVVLFRSREHENCSSQPGFVRAHIESGGYNISPLKPRNGKPRTQVQHLMQIDLKGWGVGYISSFQQYCLLQMLNSVAGLREWFSQTDERNGPPRIPVMVNMASASVLSKNITKNLESCTRTPPVDQINSVGRNSMMMDEYSDDDEEFQIAEAEQEVFPPIGIEVKRAVKDPIEEEETTNQIDLSCFSGNLRRDDRDSARDCWRISDGNNFRVRSKRFCYDKSKIPAGKHLMDLVAVDWFKDTRRMDHVARRKGCSVQVAAEKGLFSLVINLQVPGSTHYSMVYYFVTKELVAGSLLQRFVDGDDEFRNSRLKLIPSVPKGSWIVRQSVGSTPCLLGKAVDCNYIRGQNYLEIDVDIGSSTVANGVLGLVCGVITTLVVDMAFLVQANTVDELPEKLIGAIRVSHVELSSAIVPKLEMDPVD